MHAHALSRTRPSAIRRTILMFWREPESLDFWGMILMFWREPECRRHLDSHSHLFLCGCGCRWPRLTTDLRLWTRERGRPPHTACICGTVADGGGSRRAGEAREGREAPPHPRSAWQSDFGWTADFVGGALRRRWGGHASAARFVGNMVLYGRHAPLGTAALRWQRDSPVTPTATLSRLPDSNAPSVARSVGDGSTPSAVRLVSDGGTPSETRWNGDALEEARSVGDGRAPSLRVPSRTAALSWRCVP
jgi:hypothetical protein